MPGENRSVEQALVAQRSEDALRAVSPEYSPDGADALSRCQDIVWAGDFSGLPDEPESEHAPEVAMIEANKQIVHAFADAGNMNDVEAFDALLAPDFVRHCEATPEIAVASREGFKQFYGLVQLGYFPPPESE